MLETPSLLSATTGKNVKIILKMYNLVGIPIGKADRIEIIDSWRISIGTPVGLRIGTIEELSLHLSVQFWPKRHEL